MPVIPPADPVGPDLDIPHGAQVLAKIASIRSRKHRTDDRDELNWKFEVLSAPYQGMAVWATTGTGPVPRSYNSSSRLRDWLDAIYQQSVVDMAIDTDKIVGTEVMLTIELSHGDTRTFTNVGKLERPADPSTSAAMGNQVQQQSTMQGLQPPVVDLQPVGTSHMTGPSAESPTHGGQPVQDVLPHNPELDPQF